MQNSGQIMLTACMARILVGGASWGRDASDEVLCVGKKSDAFEAFLRPQRQGQEARSYNCLRNFMEYLTDGNIFDPMVFAAPAVARGGLSCKKT